MAVLVAVAFLSVIGPSAAPAFAATPAAEAAADKARVDSAVRRFEEARGRLERTEARARTLTGDLERAMRDQRDAQRRLHTTARAMYRDDPAQVVSVLLGAATFEEFASRWEILLIIGERDAEEVLRLKALRERTKRSAESVLESQAEQARAADRLEREVVAAERDLASSSAALSRYRARTKSASGAGRSSDPMQRLHGSGPWSTGVASHYGLNFSGRGASGERIGPYSMIVAHKTLPFGTLIEFEYKGRRAVARVADRGPHSPGRTFDLGPGVARVLHFAGVNTVRYRVIGR